MRGASRTVDCLVITAHWSIMNSVFSPTCIPSPPSTSCAPGLGTPLLPCESASLPGSPPSWAVLCRHGNPFPGSLMFRHLVFPLYTVLVPVLWGRFQPMLATWPGPPLQPSHTQNAGPALPSFLLSQTRCSLELPEELGGTYILM